VGNSERGVPRAGVSPVREPTMSEEHPSDVRGENVRLLERRLQRLQGLVRLYRWCLTVALALSGVLTILLFFAKAPPLGRTILINGKPLVMVRNEQAAAAVRQRLLEAGGGAKGRATFRESWEDATNPTGGERVLSVNEAVQALKDKVTVLHEAVAIEIAGQQLVVVSSREMAQNVLDRLKAKYASPSDAVVRHKGFSPEPTIRPCTVPPSRIVTDEAEAAARLTSARRQRTYVVQAGDYPERIASSHGMELSELWDLNPGLKGRTLHRGQQVQVLGRRVGLTVVTIKETVTTVTIPPGTRRQPTATLPRGEQRVTAAGRPGRKHVRWTVTMNNEREVSRRPLGEEIIVEPTPQLILIGTK
jgi:LysM repeat protein